MDVTLRHVEVFRAVMTTGSVTGAARMLRTSQPTVSRDLRRFEQLIGFRLFDRVRGRLRPTVQGLALFDDVRRSFQGLERISRAAAGIRHFEHGEVSIACLPTFAQALLPSVFRKFLERYPGASLLAHTQDSPMLDDWLSAQRYDIGLTDTLEAPPGTRAQMLAAANEVCVLPRNHPLCAKDVLELEDFRAVDFVHLAADDPYRVQTDHVFNEAAIDRRFTIETPSAEAVCSMVLQGIGVAIVNPFTALSYRPRGLQIRRIAAPIPYRLTLVRPEHRPSSEMVDRLVDVLAESCAEVVKTLRTSGLA